jgi:hypothetical protein
MAVIASVDERSPPIAVKSVEIGVACDDRLKRLVFVSFV